MQSKLKSGVLYRGLNTQLAIDEEKRTVELSFSSEQPVQRWEGNEILDHNPSSVRLERLKNGGPVLVDHDHSDHVGVIESVSIDGDRKGRATVRFGKSQRASDIFQDVIDGIRTSISVGYRVFKAVAEGNDNYRVIDWMPLEISFVSVPADASVGVGRTDTEENDFIIEREEKPMTEEVKEMPEIDVKQVTKEAADKARKDELARIREISAMAKDFDIDPDEAINNDVTVDSFRIQVLDKMKTRKAEPIKQEPVTHLDMEPKQLQRYSIIRAINAFVSNNWKGAEFERECSMEIAERLGKDPRGIFVPYDWQQKRDMTTVTSAGAVGTDHLADSFIDALRNQTVMMRLGAQDLAGLVGDVDIPRLDTSATFYWVDEDVDVTSSDGAVGSVLLSPKTVGGAVPMSRRLLKQSSPSIERIMLNDLVQGAAVAIDRAAINGSGTGGEPTGILNQAGVNTVIIADVGGVPTFAELVEFETTTETGNALVDTCAYLTTPAMKGALKTTAKDTGSGIMLWENNEANGYQAVSTNQVPTERIIFGDYSQVLVGMWGVLDIYPDTAAKAAAGGLVLRVFQDIDIALRHPVAFTKDA